MTSNLQTDILAEILDWLITVAPGLDSWQWDGKDFLRNGVPVRPISLALNGISAAPRVTKRFSRALAYMDDAGLLIRVHEPDSNRTICLKLLPFPFVPFCGQAVSLFSALWLVGERARFRVGQRHSGKQPQQEFGSVPYLAADIFAARAPM
jgi:hypothetical protein